MTLAYHNPLNLTLRSKFKVVSGSWMYALHRPMLIHPCAYYGKQMSIEKKNLWWNTLTLTHYIMQRTFEQWEIQLVWFDLNIFYCIYNIQEVWTQVLATYEVLTLSCHWVFLAIRPFPRVQLFLTQWPRSSTHFFQKL